MRLPLFALRGLAWFCLSAFGFNYPAVAAVKPLLPDEVLPRLVAGNDGLIARARTQAAEGGGPGLRGEAVRILVYVCGYVSPLSRFHHDKTLLPELEAVAAVLAEGQHPSGLFDVGNLESPPDTGFMLESLARAQLLLERDADAASLALRAKLRPLIVAAANGVAQGGVHTPNHRWGVCAALAVTHRLYPDPRYPVRIAEWLAEGIDQDADGQYAERSPAYSAKVVNPALLILAEELGRPDLIDHVRRNLALTWQLTEPTGEVITIVSRRQDQRPGAKVNIAEYYLPARWLALRDGDGRWAELARWIERDFLDDLIGGPFDPNWPLPFLLENPTLAGDLPAGVPLGTDYAAMLPGSGLVRLRRGAMSVTLSGGSDHAAGFGPASGLAMDPTFFVFRRGPAAVSARLTPAFFGTGFFYGEGVAVHGDGWRTGQTLQVPYHQPLPPEWRRADGSYALSDDGRFFSKMDFVHRPKDFRTIETTVDLAERDGGVELTIDVRGQAGVPVTLELAFTGEGKLQGVVPLADVLPPRHNGASWLRHGAGVRAASDTAGVFVLKDGRGRFAVGDDAIEFGPGLFTQAPGRMEGEDYTWVNGSLRAEGQRVYLTGVTPFRHVLTFR